MAISRQAILAADLDFQFVIPDAISGSESPVKAAKDMDLDTMQRSSYTALTQGKAGEGYGGGRGCLSFSFSVGG